MKTKKVVVGVMTAALFSLTLGALSTTYAAGETVQISVGSQEVKPGEEFSVDVALSDIPSAGIQSCDFSVEFDSSIISVTSVTAGTLTETGADKADPWVSNVPVFDGNVDDERHSVNLVWNTMADSQYWLQNEGVFCTITGTVSKDAKPGTSTDLKVIPTYRVYTKADGTKVENTVITAGYMDGSSSVRYDVKTADGKISIASDGSGETTGDDTNVVYGDANLDGDLSITDAVMIMSHASNSEKSTIKNVDICDVYNRGDGVDGMDSLSVQKRLTNIVTELPESYLVEVDQ